MEGAKHHSITSTAASRHLQGHSHQRLMDDLHASYFLAFSTWANVIDFISMAMDRLGASGPSARRHYHQYEVGLLCIICANDEMNSLLPLTSILSLLLVPIQVCETYQIAGLSTVLRKVFYLSMDVIFLRLDRQCRQRWSHRSVRHENCSRTRLTLGLRSTDESWVCPTRGPASGPNLRLHPPLHTNLNQG